MALFPFDQMDTVNAARAFVSEHMLAVIIIGAIFIAVTMWWMGYWAKGSSCKSSGFILGTLNPPTRRTGVAPL